MDDGRGTCWQQVGTSFVSLSGLVDRVGVGVQWGTVCHWLKHSTLGTWVPRGSVMSICLLGLIDHAHVGVGASVHESKCFAMV